MFDLQSHAVATVSSHSCNNISLWIFFMDAGSQEVWETPCKCSVLITSPTHWSYQKTVATSIKWVWWPPRLNPRRMLAWPTAPSSGYRPVINQSHLTGRQEPEVIHPPCFILLRFTFASSRETLTQKSTCQEDKHGPSADLLIPRNPLFYYISYFTVWQQLPNEWNTHNMVQAGKCVRNLTFACFEYY